ncbi:MAG: hypothetical protein CMH57_10600 [Myxococcales bacterium]|nr:hypothetical protein [Myxococcales bacterium]
MASKQNRKGTRPPLNEGERASDGADQSVVRLEGLIAELDGLNYDEDAERFDDIVAELVNYGDVMLPYLRECAYSLSYQERRAAVEALGQLGYEERKPIILKSLADANWKVRRSAVIAIGHSPFAEALEPMLGLLMDTHRELRVSLVETLGRMAYSEAAEALELTLLDPDWRLRQDAATALGKIGEARSFGPLMAALVDDDEDVRNAVAASLKLLIGKVSDADIRDQIRFLQDEERRTIQTNLEKDGHAKHLGRIVQELRHTISAAVDITELSSFGRVMTAEDQVDTLDRAFERDAEVENLHKILLKEGNNSVILVGEAGVGKTAIIHELARRVSEEGRYTVLETSTPELMVGTKYIGEWETKLRDLVEKIKKPRRVFLYLTNVNDLPGAGTTSSSKQNFVTLLAPYMRRGDITVVGESTSEALRTGIEKDLSIKRLFQNIKVDEPDRQTTLKVIRRQLEVLGEQSGVTLSAPAEVLDLLLDLSGTYYSTMAQPGRAVTVLRQVVGHVLEERGDSAEAIRLSSEDIIRGLARFTGLPELLLNDKLPLDTSEVEAFFERRVLGQGEAVQSIVDLITLIKAGLNDPSKPFGVFLFVGPTGVGKTEIAKALAEFIFGSPERLLRFDLSEYKEYESFEKLIGGTWRNREEGQLTSKVREQPFSVILLDEIEKAHPNIFDLFLQVFDDGRLTDARGRTADFRHTIIVMTSNIASAFSAGQVGFGEDSVGGMASAKGVMREVQRFFRPEFLNRIDRTVVFQPLSNATMRKIALRELGKVLLRSGLLRRRLIVDIDDSVVDYLMAQGFSQAMGARPLKRAVETRVLLPVAREIVSRGPDYSGDILKVRAAPTGRGGALEVHIDRVSSSFDTRRTELLEAGAAGLLRTDFAHLAKRPRSWRVARNHWSEASRRLDAFVARCELDSIEARIAEAEDEVSGVTFWDDPETARTRLLRLVRLKGLCDTVERLEGQREVLLEQLDKRSLRLDQWHTSFVTWLVELHLVYELADINLP